jgi:hypothetical protein
MYLCSICGVCSKPGEKRKLHIIYRYDAGAPGKQIDKELPVCGECKRKLDMPEDQFNLLIAKHTIRKIEEKQREREREIEEFVDDIIPMPVVLQGRRVTGSKI